MSDLTWTCPECDLEDISEDLSSCPRCDAINPSVVTFKWRSYNGLIGEGGGVDVTDARGFVVKFDHGAINDTLACQSCGAAVADWRHTTDKETGQRTNAPKVNVMRHVEFHARLGF